MLILIKNNEFLNDSIKEALKYGYTPIILYEILYDNKNQFKEDLQRIILQKKTSKYLSAIKIKLLKLDNSLPGFINYLKKDFDILIGLGGMNKINRFFIEQTPIDFLQDPHNSEYYNKLDFIHHFNSGINHVLCKSAQENKIKFIFSLNYLRNKAKVIKETGRINQNIKFASKYKIGILINFIVEKPVEVKSKDELLSLLSFYDVSTAQKTNSFSILETLIEKNNKSLKFVSDEISFE